MLRYQKGPEPGSLEELRQTPGATWKHSVHGDQREDIRASLLNDQGAVCAYCQRRIENSNKSMRIEHWLARSKNAEQQFVWTNLLGVCLGTPKQEGDEDEPADGAFHCDLSRKNHSLFLHPVEGFQTDPRDFLTYRADGHVGSGDAKATHDIRILNLNASQLVRARKALWSDVEDDVISGRLTPLELANQLQDCQLRPGTPASEYVEVKRYILQWMISTA